MNSVQTSETNNPQTIMHSDKHERKEELTLKIKTVNTQKSPVPAMLKRNNEAESLEELFKKIVEKKGENESLKVNKVSPSELEVEGISQMTLHSFLLKAEALGKNITYTRTLKVEITD